MATVRYEKGEFICEHCGDMEGIHYLEDGLVAWCSDCAYAEGLIDDKQSDKDWEETK